MKRLFALILISGLAFAQAPATKKEETKGCGDMSCCKEKMKDHKMSDMDMKDHKDHKMSDKEMKEHKDQKMAGKEMSAKKMDCCANMGKEGDMCARKPMKEDKDAKKDEKKS